MILVLSSEEDSSTNHVIDWFYKDFLRIGINDFISKILVVLNTNTIKIVFNGTKILNRVDSYWYRRDDLSLKINMSSKGNQFQTIQKNCENEFIKLKYFLFTFFEKQNSLGSFKNEKNHNKITTLFYAQILHLKTPDTLITTSKSDINFHILNHSELISKAIDNMFTSNIGIFTQTIGTQIVNQFNVERLNSSFFPTLLQNKIEKSYELRIFYMKNQFYPMAIFSQNDEKTKLDYRNYNLEKPNRNIPYILPKDIEEKLQKLMDKLDLDTGSIDMIVTPEGEYVFLEVNPTGQFGWVSENCNYYLEMKIAKILSQ